MRLPWGADDLYYPAWMEGRWHVQAVLTNYSAPLGAKYVSNAGTDVRIAERTLAEQRSRLGMPVEYDLRFTRTQRGKIAEDRLFNVAAKENAYAGKTVVSKTTYADVPGNTREDMVKKGDGPEDPLLTTLVYSKLGVQKIFVTSFDSEEDEPTWRSSQSMRTLLAVPKMGFNPLVVDEEVLTEYRRESDGSVKGRVRLLGYLNPRDSLYFAAGSKAVTIADYSLDMRPAAAESTAAAAAAAEPA